MTFQYKLKEYKNEDREYSAYLPCDKEVAENIIHSYWTGEDLPRGLELIIIANSIGQSIILKHAAKQVFEVYFLPVNEKFIFHKKSRIDLIYDTLSAFLDNNTNWLETNLNKNKSENTLVRRTVVSDTFIYEMLEGRVWSALLPTLLFGVPFSLVFIGASIVALFKMPPIPSVHFAILFLLLTGAFLSFPGLLIHFQYLKDNANIRIRITKGDNIIRVEVKGTQTEFRKADIVKMVKVENPAYKIPWSDYGYTEIQFKSGEVINLTNLIIDQTDIFKKFAGSVEFSTEKRMIPTIKKETNIK
jgi:hypothetical protein